jgi:hypothetical protein
MELHRTFGDLPGRAPKVSPLSLLIRRPDLIVHMPAFTALTLMAKRAAKAKEERRERSWERDDTSRVSAAGLEP